MSSTAETWWQFWRETFRWWRADRVTFWWRVSQYAQARGLHAISVQAWEEQHRRPRMPLPVTALDAVGLEELQRSLAHINACGYRVVVAQPTPAPDDPPPQPDQREQRVADEQARELWDVRDAMHRLSNLNLLSRPRGD
jgi:hypothetical protein